MFCNNCGNKLSDEAVFCPECGERVRESIENSVLTNDKKTEKKKICVAIAAICIVAVGITGVVGLSGRSAEATVKKYVEASIKDPNAKTIFSLIPKAVQEEVIVMAEDEEGLEGKEEVVEYLQDIIDDAYYDIDDRFGEGWSVAYKIVDEETMDRDDLKSINREYREMGVRDLKINAAKEFEVEFEITPEEGESVTRSMTVNVIKIGRKWYLDASDMPI